MDFVSGRKAGITRDLKAIEDKWTGLVTKEDEEIAQ
jgi:hypothetical protein